MNLLTVTVMFWDEEVINILCHMSYITTDLPTPGQSLNGKITGQDQVKLRQKAVHVQLLCLAMKKLITLSLFSLSSLR